MFMVEVQLMCYENKEVGMIAFDLREIRRCDTFQTFECP